MTFVVRSSLLVLLLLRICKVCCVTLQCWEMLLRTLSDSSQLVITSAQAIFLPAVSAWAYEIDYLEDKLLMYFVQQLYTCIKVCVYMCVCSFNSCMNVYVFITRCMLY